MLLPFAISVSVSVIRSLIVSQTNSVSLSVSLWAFAKVLIEWCASVIIAPRQMLKRLLATYSSFRHLPVKQTVPALSQFEISLYHCE